MFERHALNSAKLENCLEQLKSMDMVAKSKMWKFYNTTRTAFTELDREFVECRRLKRVTLKYTELEHEYYECIRVFEQWVIMAALTY